jgi:antitoxin ParD1/3/4
MDIFSIFEKKSLAMNVSLTEKQEKYIQSQLASGDYQNASELVRDALRLHEVYRNRVLDELRAEIRKGWEGASSNRSVKDIVASKRKSRNA